MSANLWDVSSVNHRPDADGVYLAGKSTGELQYITTGASALSENQAVHMGASLRGADKGCLKPFVEYKDAAGSLNWVGFPTWTPEAEWQRFEGSCVVPSGMTPTKFGFNTSSASGDMEVLNPVFSYGDRGPVYAIASSTLAWSAGIVATTRYYQLAAPTAATPTVPASSSSLGSWSETEPTADVTKVLWTCECTVYADGTESWSKASKSTSYEAAKDAKDAATGAADAAKAAQSTADGAQKAADGAKSAADKAQSTADGVAKSRALVATCGTAAATAAKVATLVSGTLSLAAGATVSVIFSSANSSASPTLDVGGTGARPILTQGSASAYWAAGAAVAFVYGNGAWNVASAPVYASTADVGDPGGRHVHVGSSSVDVMDGSRTLASFGDSRVELGRGMEVPDDSDSTRSAVIDLIDSTATLMATVLTVAKGIALKVLEIATPILRIKTDKMVSLSARHDRAGSKEYSNVLLSAYVDLAEDSTGAEAGNAPVISVTCAHRDASGTITDQTWALTHEGIQGPGGAALPVYRAASRPQEADYAAAKPCVVACDDGTAWLIS